MAQVLPFSAPSGNSLDEKERVLRERLRALGRTIVAFSGGVDSTLLLKVAHEELGENCLALTARSESLPPEEFAQALELASSMGVRHEIVDSREVENENYQANNEDRCYFCKSELFRLSKETAERHGFSTICYGAIADDLARTDRPGHRAAGEAGIASPLAEAGFSKEDVRALARRLGLPNWDKPAFACLASRIAYGTPVTPARLERVARCESLLRERGYKIFRVRDHEPVARIELGPEELERMLKPAERDVIASAFRTAGFVYVTLDLMGYRSGSMHEAVRRRNLPGENK